MNQIIEFEIDQIMPAEKDILLHQGITPDIKIDDTIRNVLDKAVYLFRKLAEPRAVVRDISIEEFQRIYNMTVTNNDPTPVQDIYPQSKAMALFVLTMGEPVSHKIDSLFGQNDFAEGCMLDSVASVAADFASSVLENMFHDILIESKAIDKDDIVLSYSPGYCGWNVVGQKGLFEYLEPHRIGITLRESYLMDPLKSVSGILIAGPADIHLFEQEYPCCDLCDTQTCRDRIDAIKSTKSEGAI